MLRSISEVTDLQGKTVLVRSSLNVPLQDGRVTNEFRIRRALPTLEHLTAMGARVIVIAHIGREPELSLRPVAEVLHGYLDCRFVPALIGAEVDAARAALQPGQVLLLENVRSDEREVANDQVFAQILAAYADIYVNDAFAVSHREQASVVGISRYLPHYAGLTFMNEYEALQKTFTPASPSLFILGGAKFETKIPLVEKFIDTYDHVFMGGALANDVLKAHGFPVGRSLVSPVDLSTKPFIQSEKLVVPTDVVVESDRGRRITIPQDVQPDEAILDVGPETVERLRLFVLGALSVLWNGPLGNYEAGFTEATERLAQVIADSEAYSVVGGGDTVAAIESLNLNDRYGFLSTAGGAMLHFLEHQTTPGIEALQAQ